MYKSISTDELKGLIGRINIIDIRDSYLFNNGNIPTSKNVPVNFLLFSPDNYMKKDTVYYIYCMYGIQSTKACQQLASKGYNVVNVTGGYNSYKD